MAACVDHHNHQRMPMDVVAADNSTIFSGDDEYTVEYIEYEMDSTVGGKSLATESVYTSTTQQEKQRQPSTVSVETVQVEEAEDDDDEYTYEEEILEVVMEETMDDQDIMDSTAKPSPLPVKTGSSTTTSSSPHPPSLMKPPPPHSIKNNSIPSYVPASPMYAGRKMSPSPNTTNNLLLSPSQKRASNSAGLSELSKQLRILQAKNESQNVDINRLERQLRILADLQGISVDNLRRALEDACASEAFGELQHKVAKLKHELEAANLLKQAELRQDAAAPAIAHLELKVGELEEVEEQQALEIKQLYEQLRQEKSKATKFESENGQLKRALQEMITKVQTDQAQAGKREEAFQKQLQELLERQAKMMQERLASSSSSSSSNTRSGSALASQDKQVVSPEMAAEYQQMVKLLKQKDEELRQAKAKLQADELRRAQALKETEEKNREAQLNMKMEADKLALTIKELEDADGQNGLRLAQFKARFVVQNERIVDMGQQLDSLYTAFDMLKEEFDSENTDREVMLENLREADAAIAKQTNKLEEDEKKKRAPGFPPSNASNTTTSFPQYVSTSSSPVARARPAIATLAPVSPATPVSRSRNLDPWTPSSISTPVSSRALRKSSTPTSAAKSYSNYSVDFNDTPTAAYATARVVNPTPEKTPTTWDILRNRDDTKQFGFEYQEGQLICGSLIVESNGMLRKWKTRPSRIYLRGEGYQWDIGEKRSFPLRFGISKVEFHPNYPLSFAVSLDPTSPNAPIIRAATANEYEYHRWMKALTKATTGEEYQGGKSDNTEEAVVAPAYIRSAQEDQEDADLQRILELSKYDT